jgi:hypothetical protein
VYQPKKCTIYIRINLKCPQFGTEDQKKGMKISSLYSLMLREADVIGNKKLLGVAENHDCRPD